MSVVYLLFLLFVALVCLLGLAQVLLDLFLGWLIAAPDAEESR